MVLKFGEIYVHHNLNVELFINPIKRFLGWETWVDKSSKIIVVVEESSDVFDINEYLTTNKSSIIIGTIGSVVQVPETVTNTRGKIAKHSLPRLDDGVFKQNFREIFANCKKYKTGKPVASVFNCIYIEKDNQVYALLRISSSENTPIFIFAYDSDFFSLPDVIYLSNVILRNDY